MILSGPPGLVVTLSLSVWSWAGLGLVWSSIRTDSTQDLLPVGPDSAQG